MQMVKAGQGIPLNMAVVKSTGFMMSFPLVNCMRKHPSSQSGARTLDGRHRTTIVNSHQRNISKLPAGTCAICPPETPASFLCGADITVLQHWIPAFQKAIPASHRLQLPPRGNTR